MIDEFTYPTAESKLITFQIGAICVSWSQIDSCLGIILGHYMKVEAAHTDVATSIIDLPRKCELIKALAFLAEDRKTYLKLERALNFLDNALRPVRNRYVHDSYSFFTGDHIRTIMKAQVINTKSFTKELVTRQKHPVTASELAAFNKDLDVLAHFLAGQYIRLIVDPSIAEENAMSALHNVLEDACDELSALIKRYSSKTKAS
ncbi:Hypothetical protein NGAL_HAMBI1145_17540 [Neorhizobium galegae bv. officinalis]|uniref:Cthe-2314-like HEPN domain-containing protein n=1 Tax=Neorhizobium galegae bv. officinalis TaxID=323656 RepID=A0A0T7FE26_NEOGA|nr:hypothetical protein [Neorhizobium galegae]CDZ33282.1 Hypothetical protein NGAL_HAMBI1145_17540 [Neorhizobium galegae bv. officinalis]